MLFCMLDFDPNSVNLYLDYINKELYKSKFSLSKMYSLKKLSFIDKSNSFYYWFPSGSGRRDPERTNKLRSKRQIKNNSIYSFEGYNFLSTFEIFINNIFEINTVNVSKSPAFFSYLSLLNESVRRHETKKNAQHVHEYVTSSWKYVRYNDYTALKYYYTFEAHRNLIRLRKLNFMALNSWFPLRKKKWLFARRNMRNFYLRWRRTEQFEFRLFRAPGMSFKYWAKQQLQYNYLNTNSSDLLIDPRSSNFFTPAQLPPTEMEFMNIFRSNNYLQLHFTFIFWLLKESVSNSNNTGLPSYFSNSYNSNQFSHGTKFRYLKNFFSSTTPKYAHIFYSRLDDEILGWDELKTYFSFFRPSYWNLKKGLDSYPHEHWAWEDVLWWEDHVPLFFSRFVDKRREEVFFDLNNVDSSNIHWFYKTWFHEEIFTELQASYYKTYFNIDYLTPGWRIQTDYPVKRMGHFDPKWHERLHEYVVYPYMNLFYPSTKRYYIDYFKHPDYIDSRSFLVLNFAWKLNTLPLFFYKFRRKFRKVIRGSHNYINPLDQLKPDFKQALNDSFLVNFFPLIRTNGSHVMTLFSLYQKKLIFLVKFFSGDQSTPDLKSGYIEYLISFLSNNGVVFSNKLFIINSINNKTWDSYKSLSDFLVYSAFISSSELLFYKERVVAEYIAFKRFYSLFISEHGNIG